MAAQDGMRVAVIVNDMAEVNIDAMLVNSSEVMKVEDKMVEMQSFEQKQWSTNEQMYIYYHLFIGISVT